MTSAEELLIIAVVAGAIVPAIALWWWHWDSVNVRVQSGVNDDAAAVAMLLSVVKAAKKTLVIRDDGNKAPATVYDDERVIDTVRSHLAENEGLNIRCLFNEEEGVRAVPQAIRGRHRSGRQLTECSPPVRFN